MAAKSSPSSRSDRKTQQQLIDRCADIVNLLVGAAKWVILGYFALQAVRALAGKTTSASFALVVHWLSSGKLPMVVAWIGACLAIIYGLLERQLRRRKTAYMQDRIKKLETKIDGHRSSSQLTKTGDTPEER